MKWDKEHLQHYLKTSVKFTQRYKAGLEPGDRSLNLVTVLARISAVQRAANSPHVNSKASMGVYTPLSSKQRYAIKRVKYWIGKGRKVNLYAESPEVLALLHRELAKLGIDSVLFTGKQDIKKRAKALHEEFRYGYCQVLLSSYVGQCGLNLEQASVVLFYERNWSHTNENQAIYRTQRPTQTYKVMVEYLHLDGSIDVYCAQLVK